MSEGRCGGSLARLPILITPVSANLTIPRPLRVHRYAASAHEHEDNCCPYNNDIRFAIAIER